MSKSGYYILALLILFIGCRSRTSNTAISWEEVSLQAEEVGCDSAFLDAGLIYLINDSVIIHKERALHENVFSIYDLDASARKFSYRAPLIKRGRGAYEFVDGELLFYDDKITLVNKSGNFLSRAYRFSVDNMMNKTDWTELSFNREAYEGAVNKICDIDSENFLVTMVGTVDDCMFYRFCLNNNTLTPTDLPFVNREGEPDITNMSIGNSGIIKRCPGNNLFVYTSIEGRVAFIFSLEENRINIKSYLSNDPFRKEKGDKNVFGFFPTLNDKYIYLAYSPLTRSDFVSQNASLYQGRYPEYFMQDVYMFDWDGNPCYKFKLDVPVSDLIVDKENKYLYATSLNESQEPYLLRFRLPE